jgi:hypothetical protein
MFDTRAQDWSKKPPLRAGYRRHCREIETAANVKACLRAGDATDLGGYPLYFVTSDGEALSFDAVRANLASVLNATQSRERDGWRVVALDINYEDSDLTCAHTGGRILSAYGPD